MRLAIHRSNRYFRYLQLLSPALWADSVKVVTALIRKDMSGLKDASEQNEQESLLLLALLPPGKARDGIIDARTAE